MICHSRQWSSESSEVRQLHTSSSASQTEESEPPPSSLLTHTSHIPFSVSPHAAVPPLLSLLTHLSSVAVYLWDWENY